MNTLYIPYHCFIEDWKDILKLFPFTSWSDVMINPQWLELPVFRTNFCGPGGASGLVDGCWRCMEEGQARAVYVCGEWCRAGVTFLWILKYKLMIWSSWWLVIFFVNKLNIKCILHMTGKLWTCLDLQHNLILTSWAQLFKVSLA